MTRLRRSDPSLAGITRRRRGKGFSYIWQSDGSAVTDPDTLERIAQLVIPPAWNDVWICPWPHGHIQAIGVDAAGRRQYRYHDAWREKRDLEKFERMIRFGHALPRLRDVVAADLKRRGFCKERVLAAGARLLDVGFFRIGGEEYAEENDSFGLATLERSHVQIRGAKMHFDYPAKSGQRRVITVSDAEVAKLLRALQTRKGGNEDLLAWRDGADWVDMKAEDVNAYLKETAGDEFSAKDFRTWSGTVLAALALATRGPGASKTAGRRIVSAVCKEVSAQLGNTPAVCRKSYVDPRVFDRFDAGETIAEAISRLGDEEAQLTPAARRVVEAAVIDLLEEEQEAKRRAAA